MTNDIRGARLVLLPGVGHSPHIEAPQAVLDQLLPFLRRQSGIGGNEFLELIREATGT